MVKSSGSHDETIVRPVAARTRIVPTKKAALVVAVTILALLPVAISPLFLSQSLRLDEAQSLWQTSRSVPQIFLVVAGDVHVPLYHILLHTWRLSVSDTVAGARLLSLLFFVLSIPLLYLLGARAYSRRVALFATLLFALSPFMNWYANEIRMYTLFAFLTIANQYFFLRLVKKPTPALWLLYIVSASFGIFSDYFFFLNLGAQAAFYFLRWRTMPRGTFRRLSITAGIVVVLIAPWLWYVRHLGTVGFETPNLPLPTTVNLFSTFSQFLFGFQSDAINTILLSLWPLAVVLGIVALRKNARLSFETEYFGLSILFAFIVMFFGSFVFAPVFVSRYLIFTLPACYLIIARAFEAYAPSLQYVGRAGLVALVLAMLMIEARSPVTPVKENYAGATSFLAAHATAQDAIILSAPFTVYPVQYYYHGPAVISTLPDWDQYAFGPIPPFNAKDLPSEVAKETADAQNVYLLLSYNQGYEENIRNYFDSHYQRLYSETFSDDLTVYVYRLRYNTGNSAIATSL